MASRSNHRPPVPAPAAAGSSGFWPTLGHGVLVFAAVLVAYWPALRGAPVWDDVNHLTRPELRSVAGLGRIWFELGATQQYYPLLHSAFWLEHRLWGDAVLGYHLVNVLLHAGAACLFAAILRRLAVPGAGLAALVFALHPVGVESVAWISEQKNTLSLCWGLVAALVYLRFAEERRRGLYLLATGLFVCALLTKSVTAVVPGALLVILWWRQGRLDWRRDIGPLLPWLALGATAGLFTAWVERTMIGAQGGVYELGLLERFLLAGRVPWFYLGKLVWPAELMFIYPRWTISAADWHAWLAPAATLSLLAALWWRRGRQRGLLAVALLFGGMLFPVLGFLNVYPFVYSFVADHFQYSASLAMIGGAAAVVTPLAGRLPAGVGRAVAALLLLVLGTLTWRQSATYRDPVTLYETTLQRNPACWMAHNNLGVVFSAAGQADRAMDHFQASLRLYPANAEAENNLGYEYFLRGRNEEAVAHFRRALGLQPGLKGARNNLGHALLALGRLEEGVAVFAETLQQHPRDPGASYNHGLALARSGRVTEAIAEFARAVELRPDYAAAEAYWGTALLLTRRPGEAVPHFERALSLDPGSADVHYKLALALRELNRLDEARHHYLAAQKLGGPP